MGLLTFALNVTLDGCRDHREGVADDEMLRYWTRVMDAAGAMLFGRRTATSPARIGSPTDTITIGIV